MHSHCREPGTAPVNQFRTVLSQIEIRDNPFPVPGTGLGKIRKGIRTKSGGCDRQVLKFGTDSHRLAMAVAVVVAVWAALAASLGARAKRLIHDLANGPGAAATLGATAKAAIDLPRSARQIAGISHSVADVVVANDVAGTNDHGLRSVGPVKTFTID